jgi:SpoVK/Ycf46/Vps4 family AAA+-type ATPase
MAKATAKATGEKTEKVKMVKDTSSDVIEREIIDPTKKDSKKGYEQWAIAQDGTYWPTFDTTKKVPPGVYEIHSSSQGMYLKKQRFVLSDTVLELPMPVSQEILADMEIFWEMRHKFEKYKMVYKRGILLHGPPGCGKSYLLQNIMNKIVSKGGIVITCNDENDVSNFCNFVPTLRDVEPDRALVVIIEDIDNVVSHGSSVLSNLLNILDGVKQIDNVVYLATTNYPERLQERISNRPSRFDRVYELPVPTDEVREYFLRHKLHAEDIRGIDMKEWVTKTDGLSLSHIKEIIVSVMILGKKLDDIIEHFGEMKRPKNSRSSGAKLGYGSSK